MSKSKMLCHFMWALAVTAVPLHMATAAEVTAEIEKGRQVFLTAADIGCAACHGKYAEGDVGIGPYNRGVGQETIRGALDSIGEMEFLSLTDAEISQIAAYYAYLGELQLFKTLVKRGRFIPNEISVFPGTSIQLVLNNASRSPRTFVADGIGIDELKVSARSDQDIVWTVPEDEGVFTLRCTDCRLKNEVFTINVSRDAAPFPPTTAPAEPEIRLTVIPPAQRDLPLIEAGRDVFMNAAEVGCVACHGLYAEGDVGIGPYNRGFDEARIRSALENVDAMAFLRDALGEDEIKQVAAYYARLGELKLVKTRVVRGRFVPDRVRVHPGTKVQLVVNNASQSDRTFTSQDMGIEDFYVPGREALDLVWVAPGDDGTYALSCTDCPDDSQHLTIEVTQAAPQFRVEQ